MKFQKGRPKTGGRKKGTPNRSAADLKGLITAIVNERMDTLQERLKELDTKD